MATPIIMPRQGQSVESCIIAKWYKQKGDSVNVGDVLFNYETDKATFDEESKVSGVMLDVFFEEGDEVPCLTNVCVIGEKGETADEFNPNPSDKIEEKDNEEKDEEKRVEVKDEEKVVEEVKEEIPEEISEEITGEELDGEISTNDEIKISPRANNVAEKAGVDIRLAKPSGPDGRIIERDIDKLRESGTAMTKAVKSDLLFLPKETVEEGTGLGGKITTEDLEKAKTPVSELPKETQEEQESIKEQEEILEQEVAKEQAPIKEEEKAEEKEGEKAEEFERVRVTNIRKVIANAMQTSLSNSAQLTLNTSFDASDIMKYRKELKASEKLSEDENITINDIIVFVVARTLLNHKDLNAHFLGDEILYFKNAHIGVAVDTERGLMVPTLMSANQKTLREISNETKELASNCKKGTINPDILKGASFTITNLGTLGVESFTPVINPPQLGILGVNNINMRIKKIDKKLAYYPAMGLSLTFDHRGIDGAPAAKFTQELVNNLENFTEKYKDSII